MTIFDMIENEVCEIESIKEEESFRLMGLGFIVGQKVRLLKRGKDGAIVSVLGSTFYMGYGLSKKIKVLPNKVK